jgi:hypothetical protein
MKRTNYQFKTSAITLIIITIIWAGKLFAQNDADSFTDDINGIKDQISGVDERLKTVENDVSSLKKIKFSGYIQAQWEHFENPSVYPANYFSVRRARLKATYEPVTGVAFVLQPDFAPGNLSLKDAYAQVNEPWLKTFSLWMGQFNRTDYEVEYSSSKREMPERSRIIRALYPGERALGFKLEASPQSVPLKVQIAMFNGNDFLTINDVDKKNDNPTNKDYDDFKDLMVRATYQFRLGHFGSLDFGAHGYFGAIKATSTDLLDGEYKLDKTVKIGDRINKQWYGLELQFYADVLGGMAIKGEYILGKQASVGASSSATQTITQSALANDTLFVTTTTTTTTTVYPGIVRDFSGYYVYLIKNIGKKNQFAMRWDVYDPNTKLGSSDIGLSDHKYDNGSESESSNTVIEDNTSTTTVTRSVLKNTLGSGTDDIKYGTLSFAWHHYFNENIRVTLAYEMPFNEKVDKNSNGVGNVTKSYTVNGIAGKLDYSEVFPQNVLTLRIQAKF